MESSIFSTSPRVERNRKAKTVVFNRASRDAPKFGDVLERKIDRRTFGEKFVNRLHSYGILRVQGCNAAQQDIAIDKNAHLPVIRINRFTADGLVG